MILDFGDGYPNCLNEAINLLKQIGKQIKILTLIRPEEIKIHPECMTQNLI